MHLPPGAFRRAAPDAVSTSCTMFGTQFSPVGFLPPQDWIVLGLIASMPVLMVLAIWLIRSGVRQDVKVSVRVNS